MKFLFGLIALGAALVLILSIIRPCSKNHWLRIVLSIIVLIAGIAGFRHFAEDEGLSVTALVEEVQTDASIAWNKTRETGNQTVDEARNPSEQALKELESAGASALNATQEAGNAVMSQANEVKNDALNATREASESANATLDNAVDAAAGTASDLYDDAKEKINEFGAAAADTAEEARQAIENVVDELEHSANQTSKDVEPRPANATNSTNSTK